MRTADSHSRRPKFVVADTMDLWLNIALPDLLKLLKRVDGFVLNDSEARQLTKDDNLVSALKKIHKLGPKYVIIKKGEHGAILSSRNNGLFLSPAYPLHRAVDPTGAGDSFAGGFMGYIASQGEINREVLKRALFYGGVMGSFAVENFGTQRLENLTREQIDARFQVFRELTHLE